jgi:hypothetical protein
MEEPETGCLSERATFPWSEQVAEILFLGR